MDPFDGLARELSDLFSAGVRAPWPEPRFDELARRVFHFQFEANEAYGAYCRARGCTPERMAAWGDAPCVPVRAFRHLDLVAGTSEEVERVFRTSGTTGEGVRGRHLVRSLALYRSSLLPTFRAHLVPDAVRIPFLSLIPPPGELPDSSLSFMVEAASEVLASRVEWLVDGSGQIDLARLRESALAAAVAGEPVLLLGTAFAFVHLVEGLGGGGRIRLPEGSRIMETGGFKGRAREVPRAELYAAISACTGVPTGRIVNEYGMTELLSQLYEPVLGEGASAVGVHSPPPWLRVRALDPVTLAVLPAGATGVLGFFDLANLGSVSSIVTEDLGTVDEAGRVRLHGRMAGAEPRGCSRAMDDLLSAAGRS